MSDKGPDERNITPGSQQTCLLAPGHSFVKPALSNKVIKAMEYRQAKKKDKLLGPVPRPQDIPSNEDFFKDAVRRNLGLPKPGEPVDVPANGHNSTHQEIYSMGTMESRNPTWISSEDEMKILWKSIKSLKYLAVDFENNVEHSYLGMIALVQISMLDRDIIIDPFPDFNGLRKLISNLMSGEENLKIFCGGDNDFIHVHRIFELVPQKCIYIQILDQRLKGSQQPRGLKALCKTYLNMDISKGETNREWRRRPLPKEMMDYAQADSYYCLAVFLEMKKQLLEAGNTSFLEDAIMATQIRIRKLTSKPSKARNLPSTSTFEAAILKWRETEAKLLDDKPENILSDAAVKRLLTERVILMEDLKRTIGRNHVHILRGHIAGLLRLVREQSPYFESTVCHKCGLLGHSAIQCNQCINRKVEKTLNEMDPGKKTMQNRRRRLNQSRNRKVNRLKDVMLLL